MEEKNEKKQKLSYEELNNACAELSQENQRLQATMQKMYHQMQQMDMSNQFKRLDYLFKVLEFEGVIKDPEFIISCVDEIKTSMTIPEEEPKQENKEGN